MIDDTPYGDRHNMWAVIRTFVKKGEDAAKQAEALNQRIANALEHSAKVQSTEMYMGLMFVVPIDVDCGETADRLQEAFAGQPFVRVLRAAGNQNSDVLTAAFHELAADRVQFATIVSGKAVECLTRNAAFEMVRHLYRGFKVVGLHTAQSVMLAKDGVSPLDNSCATWNIQAVIEVGGFTSERTEEVTVAMKIIRRFGVNTVGMIRDGKNVGTFNIVNTDDARAHHEEVLASKLPNQRKAAESIGMPLSFLLDNIVELEPVSA